MQKTAVLLVNLGTPLSYHPRDVKTYLHEFLLDPKVLDLPSWFRYFLVKAVIVPGRYRQSARAYKAIWQKQGSPLLIHTQAMAAQLQKLLGDTFIVDSAMRYQQPSIQETLQRLQPLPLKQLVIIPLFPQYAAATTGSICEEVFNHLKTWPTLPGLKIVNTFYDHPQLIEAFSAIAASYPLSSYDHVVISFHGLPERHIKKADPHRLCLTKNNCCKTLSSCNAHCYSAQCYAMAHAIASTLKLSSDRYSIGFQSRLGKDPWLTPSTSDILQKLPQLGKKNILVMAPSFVGDCLETLYEIAIEYDHLFQSYGGTKLTLMRGLNDNPLWIKTLQTLVLD